MAKAGTKSAAREALGTEKGVLTPIGALVGLGRVIWQNLLQPLRLVPLFALRPWALPRRADALDIDVCGEAAKLFGFMLFVAFALGDRFGLAAIDLFLLGTAFDAFVFEIAGALFLLLLANLHYAALRLVCSTRRLFQGVLTANAGALGYLLFLVVFGSVAFDILRAFFPQVIADWGMTPAELWERASTLFVAVYVPLFGYVGYVRWLSRCTGAAPTMVAATAVLAAAGASGIVYASLASIHYVLGLVQAYGSVV